MNVIPCTDSAVQGNDFELISMVTIERGHSVEGSFSREFSSIYIGSELSPFEVGSRWRCYGKICLFEKNDLLREDFQNFVPKGFTTSQIHVLCANFTCKFREIWPTGNQQSCALITGQKKTKFRLALSSLLLVRGSHPKSARASGKQCTGYSECPKFHPNWFTSGGVIAECMNTIQTRHVVFPILGKATASSLSNRLTCTAVTAGLSHKNNL